VILHMLEHLVRDDQIEACIPKWEPVRLFDQEQAVTWAFEGNVATDCVEVDRAPGSDGVAVSAAEIENACTFPHRATEVGSDIAKELDQDRLLLHPVGGGKCGRTSNQTGASILPCLP
jgi:hypothetical protein